MNIVCDKCKMIYDAERDCEIIYTGSKLIGTINHAHICPECSSDLREWLKTAKEIDIKEEKIC